MSRRSVSDGTRFRVLQRDRFRCRYCGAHGSETVLHIDHVHPVSAGGTSDPENLVTACQSCNLGKGASLLRAPKAPVACARNVSDTGPAYLQRCNPWRSNPAHTSSLAAVEPGRCTRNIDDIEDHECDMPRAIRGWYECRRRDSANDFSHRKACA